MNFLDLPKNITGINYNLINEYFKISIIYDKINYTNDDIIESKISVSNNIDMEQTIIDNILRLEPPYNISCSFLSINNCQKKAAFQHVLTSKYYCWFHMHCNN